MSTTYSVESSQPAVHGLGIFYRVRAESTTPGCSRWYSAFVTRRGSLVVTELDDATGTAEKRDLDGEQHRFPHDDPIRRQVAEAVERYDTETREG